VIKSRRMITGYIVQYGRHEKLQRIFVGEREGKKPFGRPRYRRKDNTSITYGLDLSG
jgi:hypothetical protein